MNRKGSQSDTKQWSFWTHLWDLHWSLQPKRVPSRLIRFEIFLLTTSKDHLDSLFRLEKVLLTPNEDHPLRYETWLVLLIPIENHLSSFGIPEYMVILKKVALRHEWPHLDAAVATPRRDARDRLTRSLFQKIYQYCSFGNLRSLNYAIRFQSFARYIYV